MSGEPTREERERRRDSFPAVAEDYFAARPPYPSALLETAVELGEVAPGGSVLELGCGTGEVTGWLAEQGFRVVALDRSAELLTLAERRLGQHPAVELRQADFEDATAVGPYDALVAATSYHWLDPETRVDRCAGCLRPNGALILLWHTHPPPYRGFFERSQPIYRRLMPGWTPPPSPGMSDARVAHAAAQLEGADAFSSVARRSHDWTRTYPTKLYLRLLNTYSDHRLLPERIRAELFEALGELIDRDFDGQVVRPYRTELVVARRAT